MPDDNGISARRSWREALAVYAHPRVAGMLFLGFSAGLPFLLIFATLSAWLREAGVTATTIGFFSWAGIMFSIKVVWAPVIDRLPLPGLTRWLGRRRGWMLLGQIGVAAGLLGIAASDPAAEVGHLAVLAVAIAFFSATQDVAIDAYRIEAVERRVQGAMAAAYILGYRVALLTGGAGTLYIAEFVSWSSAYTTMAALMGVGMATVLLIREPETTRDRARLAAEDLPASLRNRNFSPRARMTLGWLYSAVVCPFLDFFRRYGRTALLVLLFVGVYRLSDITMGVMANPFYIDLGFTKAEIASVTKVFGFFMSIAGAFLGGLLVARMGVLKPLVLGAVLVAGTNLLFAWMAHAGPDLRLLTVTISADNLSGGLAGAVFVAYLSSLTSTAYTATQYALFSSLMTLPGKFMGGFSGVVVDSYGYVEFFLVAAGIGLPAIALAIVILHRGKGLQPGIAGAE
ncbi:AmpG family muropeptide MFS transporter [Ferruginivarius sediminum]|uniref:MFS transporter n=1 Tax=Ferruginivarius sediminum TaxID=2661937 RepID=A0A369TDM2_9PROT|nr:AmpG family muropeptide MFS transporter [Ferruginivarius sediminum]RDD63378.1 MFS transporter [Ferruginivarius sediminum]